MEWNLVGLAAIITSMVGLLKFFDEKSAKKNGEMLSKMDEKLDAMDARIEKGQQEDRLAITRLEILGLIDHDASNKAEIEKLARYYFNDLGGDTWMSGVFSEWCREQGIDPSVVLMK